jgi:formylmethanofuran dehydrogenase subunit E
MRRRKPKPRVFERRPREIKMGPEDLKHDADWRSEDEEILHAVKNGKLLQALPLSSLKPPQKERKSKQRKCKRCGKPVNSHTQPIKIGNHRKTLLCNSCKEELKEAVLKAG